MTEKEAQKQVEKILKEAGFKLGYKIAFPVYNILPDEVKLALNILAKHKMEVQIILKPFDKNAQ